MMLIMMIMMMLKYLYRKFHVEFYKL